MLLVRRLADLPATATGGAVSIGNFDGVHRGHAALLEQLTAAARRLGGPAVVFTFDPHPARLLRPQAAPIPLTWLERKAALLEELGADFVVAYPTDRDLLALSADDFFHRIVRETLAARAMVEGPNFHFGRGRSGDVHHLAKLCSAVEIELTVVAPQSAGAGLVSSSRVRASLLEGEVATAAEMLGRPHRVRGHVEEGDRRGRTIGFPTANLGGVDTLLPANGVYAARAFIEGARHAAAVNVGPAPTFGIAQRKVEAHLLDFSGDLYGRPMQLDFHARIRGVAKFASKEALVQQLADDIAEVRRLDP